MKATQIILPVFLLAIKFSTAQNIGIGVSTPAQKLEVNGAIKIASNDAVAPVKGTMRWNDGKNDFEGYNGFSWVSLTNGKSGIGDGTSYVHESDGIDPMLSTSSIDNYNGFGKKIIKSGTTYFTSAPDYTSVFSEDLHAFTKAGILFRWFKAPGAVNYSRYKLSSPSPQAEGKYGFDIAGDEQRIIVTEPGAKVGSNNRQGRAFIYSNQNFTAFSSITAADGVAGEEFGYAAAIKGNYAVVSSPMKMIGSVRTGRVYIYKLNTGTGSWASAQIVGGNADLDMFGAALAISNEWLAIGVPKAAYGSDNDHGKVQMLKLNTTTGNWSSHSTVLPLPGSSHNGFGAAITIKNDTMMITEAPESAGYIARHYMYILKNNVWEQVKEFSLPHPTTMLAASQADFLGDKVLIGESQAKLGAMGGNGKAYLYEWKNNDWIHTNTLVPRIPQARQYFGRGLLLDQNVIFCSAVGAHGFFNYSGMMFSFDLP